MVVRDLTFDRDSEKRNSKNSIRVHNALVGRRSSQTHSRRSGNCAKVDQEKAGVD